MVWQSVAHSASSEAGSGTVVSSNELLSLSFVCLKLFLFVCLFQGLIFGFISKEAAQDLLRGRPVGTFLIRFSEQSAGQFAVACVAKVHRRFAFLFVLTRVKKGKKGGETVIKVCLFVSMVLFCAKFRRCSIIWFPCLPRSCLTTSCPRRAFRACCCAVRSFGSKRLQRWSK